MTGVWFLPESPRWLQIKDRHADARNVLARLEGEAEDSELVTSRMQVIQNSIYLEQKGHSNNPFARTPNRHLNRTLLAIGVNILAQMSGINVITFYSNKIFQDYLGYSATVSRVISGCLQTWQFVAASAAVFLIDRFGRRRLLLIGAALMAISNAGLAGLESHLTNPTIAGVSLLFYFLALGTFPICLFLIPFLYSSEIAPLKIRSRITAMSAAGNWLFNFLVAEVSPVAFTNIGWKYYLVYTCTNTLSFVVFYFFAPESKSAFAREVPSTIVILISVQLRDELWKISMQSSSSLRMPSIPSRSLGTCHRDLLKSMTSRKKSTAVKTTLRMFEMFYGPRDSRVEISQGMKCERM